MPGKGDYPLYPNTAHSIELYAETEIESWGKPVRIKLEEDAFFDGESTYYIDGRQKQFLLIGPGNQRRITAWLRELANGLDIRIE